MAQNDRVPGLNGQMFMRWKGDDPGTEVMASVQWFAKKKDLLAFYAQSTKREDYELGEFDGTTLWKIGVSGYSWTDGEHFLVSLGGSPAPPPEMVKAWLAMIASEVAEVEKEGEKKPAPADTFQSRADALNARIEKAAVQYTHLEYDGAITLLTGFHKEIDALAEQYPKKNAEWMPGVQKTIVWALLAATYKEQNKLKESARYEALFRKQFGDLGKDVDFDEFLSVVTRPFEPEIRMEIEDFGPRDKDE
jgi:hypothetical protein